MTVPLEDQLDALNRAAPLIEADSSENVLPLAERKSARAGA